MLTAEALRKMYAGIPATPRIDLGLARRRRRNEHDWDVGLARAYDRHIARMVAHAVLLLVGRIMLFIDDNQREIGIGQKQGRACTDDHADAARHYRVPGARAQ